MRNKLDKLIQVRIVYDTKTNVQNNYDKYFDLMNVVSAYLP